MDDVSDSISIEFRLDTMGVLAPDAMGVLRAEMEISDHSLS